MNGRSSSFLLIAATMLLVLMVVQMIFKPPAEPDPAASEIDPVAQLTGDETPEAPAGAKEAGDEEKPDADPAVPREHNDPAIIVKSDASIVDYLAEEPPPPTAADNAFVNQRSFTADRQIGELVTIGSLDPDSGDRYLITLNTLGGTVRRIELNERDPRSGRFRYRDLEWIGGYLGSLDCVNTEEGVRVSVVGPGTPADAAGIKAGDIIVSVGGANVTSALDFEQLLSRTKPRTELSLETRRDGETLSSTVTLTDKPIEVIRPEPGILDPLAVYPESFQMTLLRPEATPQKVWQEIDADMRVAQWTIEDDDPSDDIIAMTFKPSPAALKKLGYAGEVSMVKRFSIPSIVDEETAEATGNDRTWHWDLDLEIRNEAEENQQIGLQVSGPTGTPSETWWYAQKTHGRSTAIGYVAGARDVVGATDYEDYVFYGTAEIVKQSLAERPEPRFFTNPYDVAQAPEQSHIRWLGVDTLYFNVAMLPVANEGQPFTVDSALADINGGLIPKNVRDQKLVDCTFRFFKSIDVPAGESWKQSFQIFTGPKEAEILDAYGLDDNRTFGWFWWCSKPLLWLLHVLYFLTFKISYAIPIVLLTLMVRSIMIPFSRKAALNAQMMQHLQPQMKEMAEKYKDDMEGRSAAQRELFQKYNYNPLGGCWMMFIQLPIFIGLYRGLSVDIALRDQPMIPGLQWCSNLSGPDQFWYWKDMWPSWLGESGWFGPYLNILPLVTMVLFLLQQKLFTPPAMDEQQQMAQKMMSFMMIFMAVMFFKVPAGLCIYFITSSLWGIIERKMLPKPKLDVDRLEAAAGGDGGNAKSSGRFGNLLSGGDSSKDPFTKAREQVEAKKKRKKLR